MSSFVISNQSGENAVVKTYCRYCRRNHQMTVPSAGVDAMIRGEFVQNAFPTLSADDRERLISGTCPECWNRLFGEK